MSKTHFMCVTFQFNLHEGHFLHTIFIHYLVTQNEQSSLFRNEFSSVSIKTIHIILAKRNFKTLFQISQQSRDINNKIF